jgi:hypothetical protein
MGSAARIRANRLTAEEGTGPGTPRGTAAMRRSSLRYPPAELRSTALPTAAGEIPRKSYIGLAEPIYRMKSGGAVRGKANSMQPGTALASYREMERRPYPRNVRLALKPSRGRA